jgi:putative membrane protein
VGAVRLWPTGLRDGSDPDPRFTLANERTFLAWIRTSLGLVATAAALEAFGGDLLPPWLRTTLVLGLLTLAAVLAVGSFVRWIRIETAMRRRASLPLPAAAALLAGGLVIAVVAFAVGLYL